MVGNTIIVVFVVVILGQTVFQGLERRREHRQLLERLDQLEAGLRRLIDRQN